MIRQTTQTDASSQIRLWTPPPITWMQALLLSAVMLAAGLSYYSQHVHFPLGFHPDEPSKVFQVQTGNSNFNHPQLLINTTRLVWVLAPDLVDVPNAEKQIVVLGRYVSAGFAALSVVLLALTAMALMGRTAGWITGAFVLLLPAMVTAAHYMKEDTALIFGLSAWLAALAFYWRRPTAVRLLLVSIGCGLALSGKYIGAVALPITLLILIAPPNGCGVNGRGFKHWAQRAGIIFGGAMLTCALINLPAMFNRHTFITSVTRELKHAVTDHNGIEETIYTLRPLQWVVDGCTWPMVVAAVAGLLWAMVSWRRLNAPQRLMVLLPFGFFLVLQAARIHAFRYMLPVHVLLAWCAMLAVIAIGGYFKAPRARALAAAAIMLLIAVPMAVHSYRTLQGFATDGRLALREWVDRELEPGAHVLADRYAALPPELVRAQGATFDQEFMAMELGDLKELQAMGYTHLVLCDLTYRRFFEPGAQPSAEAEEEFRRLKSRYGELLYEQKPIWQAKRPPGFDGFSSPTVSVYRIAERPPQQVSSRK